jgi:putative Mn2+ efflux pump MntP
MSSSTKRDKQAEREARRAEKEMNQEVIERAERRKRIIMLAIPVLIGLAAAGAGFGLKNKGMAGAILLTGLITWLMVALGFIGSTITPRDRIAVSRMRGRVDGPRGR